MSTLILKKEKIVIADIELGMGTVEQDRGTGTQLNADVIPYSTAESIASAIDRKADTAYMNSRLDEKAKTNGDITEVFNVSTGIEDGHAVTKAQLDLKPSYGDLENELNLKADKLNVLELDNTVPYTPTTPYHPSTKIYVDQKLIDIGAGDMRKSTYDTNDSGSVDTADGIGLDSTFMGVSPQDEIMRLGQTAMTDLNTLDAMGVYIGEDVNNSPVAGGVLVEQYVIGDRKSQKLFTVSGNVWYSRSFNGSIWTGWLEIGTLGVTLVKFNYVVGTVSGEYDGSLTNFPALYVPGNVDVYLEGLRLIDGTDYIASTGEEIVLINGGIVGNNIQIVSFATVDIVDTYTKGEIDNKDSNTLVEAKEYTDSQDVINLATANDYTDAQTALIPVFPTGGVIMWSGTVANIPSGWLLCDGTNSTPDLRGRFVYGATDTHGAVGGSADSIVPEHSHTATGASTFTGAALPAHSHTVQRTNFNASINDTQQGSVSAGTNTATSAVSAGTPTGTVATSVTVAAEGVTPVGANMPPYYVLAYIMKG